MNPSKQRCPKFFFHSANLAADGTGRHIEFRRRILDAAIARRGLEGQQRRQWRQIEGTACHEA